jgi:hypothetical protein
MKLSPKLTWILFALMVAAACSNSEAASGAEEPITSATSLIEDKGAGFGNVDLDDPQQVVNLSFESKIADISQSDFERTALQILNDPRGWAKAGFTFKAEPQSSFRVVLAEGFEVDKLCDPLDTHGQVSCQNGPVVALNAERWREAVEHWDASPETYRGYLANHEVGHLLGQRHPRPSCPKIGQPAGVMEQQTGGLKGCKGNPWPRDWEIEYAKRRPVVYAPKPDWAPDPVPSNQE